MRLPLLILAFLYSVVLVAQNKPDGATAPVQSGLTIDPTPGAYTTGHFINYVRAYQVQAPGLSESSITSPSQSAANVLMGTRYFDGLGRHIQTVSRKAATGGVNDMVEAVYYDQYGRQSKGYLPYRASGNSGNFRISPFTEQDGFYDAHFGGNEDVYYKKNEYENSPLNKVLKHLPAGNSWGGSGRGSATEYKLNTNDDGVRIPVAGLNNADLSQSYAEGELSLIVTTDENGHKMRSFTNKKGQVILKQIQKGASSAAAHTNWLSTYYAYDDRNNLRYVLPPRAVDILEANSWTHTSSIAEFCFEYGYDGRNRMITKKVPGTGEFHMVFDKQNRVVLVQDENQRLFNQWTFNKYDALNRLVLTGFVTDASSRSTLQTAADGWTGDMFVTRESMTSGSTLEGDVIVISYRDPSIVYYRTKSDGSIEFRPGFETTTGDTFETLTDLSSSYDYTSYEDYHDATFPLLRNYNDFEMNSVNYYDDYEFTATGWSNDYTDFYASGVQNAVTPAQNTQTTGQPTGSKSRILGTNKFLTGVIFYDDRGRPVQTNFDNHLGGKDIITTQYDFMGRVLHTYTKHHNPQSSTNTFTRILKQFTYDHAGRVLTIKQKLNDTGSLVTLESNSYNNLGKLSQKVLGGGLETLDYEYNIRGWLKSINGDELDAADHDTQMNSHYFAMELDYDYGFIDKQYNGNIAGIKWKSRSSDQIRAYGFNYDQSNRLTTADYTQGSSWNNTVNDFSTSYTYDVNGNILSLLRKGTIAGTIATIDNLSYDYGSGFGMAGTGNQLLKVSDAAGDLGQGDFVDGNTSGDDYSYDANGNMKDDQNKGVTNITYNHLNLPETVSFGSSKTITYVYNATGLKIQKVVNDNGSLTTTDYVGKFIYEDGVLLNFSHEEGRVRRKENGTLVNDFFIKDHLGNTRMTLTSDTDQVEYRATMEVGTNSAGEVVDQFEESTFLMLSNVRDNTVPTANTTNVPGINDSYSAKLNGTDANRRVGPGKMLVVSAGDQLDISVDSYHSGSYSNSSQQGQSTMVTAIAGLFGGVSTGNTEQQAIYDLFDGSAATAYVGTRGNGSKPKAYLNVLVFDQDFNLVSSKSTFKQTTQSSGFLTLSHTITMSEGGFVYVYLSNEDNVNFNVHFDDLSIIHTKGAILQEDHYYPYGMNMAALSSDSPLAQGNKVKYNGKEEQTDFDLNWYDYGARNYDAQIGRWFNIDPLADKYESLTPYNYVGNIPVRLIDPDGKKVTITGKDENKKKLKEKLKQLRKASKTFRKMYRKLKRSKKDFILHAADLDKNSLGGIFIGNYKKEGEPAPEQLGGLIVVNLKAFEGREDLIVETALTEELTHAAQYDLTMDSPEDAYKSKMGGTFDVEFEAKVITGRVMQEAGLLDSYSAEEQDIPPHTLGADTDFKNIPKEVYQDVFKLFQQAADKNGGYNGKKSTDPGAVTNSEPKLLNKLLKKK